MRQVGQNIPHDSAHLHATGTSVFVDDMPPAHGEVVVGIVPSPKAHARVLGIDTTEAIKIPGVLAVLTHRDIPGHNLFGAVAHDEFLLAENEALFIGHPLVIVVAENAAALKQGKKAVRFELEELPAILTIDQALEAKSFLSDRRKIERGDVAGALAAGPRTISGSLDIAGQEHFYLESHASIAIPGEDGAFVVHSSTQHPTEVQSLVAGALGVAFNKVSVICKRMGGGFGGKETQAAQPAMFAALAAQAVGRPARFVYNKDDDMRFTGKRHPFKIFYEAAFTDEGLITAVDFELYSDGGCSLDLSMAVLERAMLHADNAYFIPNFRVIGQICKTNLPSNTAFRGFGGPQGVAGMENLIEEIAQMLGTDALEIRRRNCYGSQTKSESLNPKPETSRQNSTQANPKSKIQNPKWEEHLVAPYGQIVRNNMLPRLFDQLRNDCDYDNRRQQIARFNGQSPTYLRGMSMTAVKFGISFTHRTLNQANALVNIYLDGTVMVSTGATEMGQGVNTRIAQLVADELGLPLKCVRVLATNTEKNNNTSPTAASSGTDLNGAAAVDACRQLLDSLRPVAAEMLADAPQGLHAEANQIRFADGVIFDIRRPGKQMPFQQLIAKAYEKRINLGARGFYATPGIDFNRDTGRGNPFLYYTNGVACTEVQIDRFTGEMHLSRVDLLMDVGQSINPGIDRGQITGGFIQGAGWVTTEELVYSEKGALLSHSPTTYKIPNISDLPPIFNVNWIDNPDNEVSLMRSKAVGEPPLLLGVSAFTAVKDALSYVAQSPPAKISLPATGERILLAIPRPTRSPVPAVPAHA